MAKIVTITNPLTGQPAQVDQLDHTAQQIDDGLNIARGVPNPNLLDNWYFGNPVDQRGGYVITPNTRIYSDAGLTNLLATAGPNEYVQIQTVTEITDTYAKFIDSGGSVRYTEAAQAPVRGYTGARYGIDRWYQNLNSVILITDAGLVMNSTSGEGYFFQHIEDDVSGKMVTFSALFEDGTLLTGTGIAPTSIGIVNIAVGNKNRLYLERSAKYALTTVFAIAENANSKCIAAKLELGTQQTLAHQDENGNWVMNEIPDYGEQLARCQRYCNVIKAVSANSRYGYGIGTGGNILVFVPINVPLRAVPTITMVGDFIAWSGATPHPATFIAFNSVSTNGVTFSITSNDMTVGQVYQFIDAGTGNSAIILDANL